MQNKLQELTERLYNEGLSKGKQEAEELKASAVKESERIIADARKEADRIIAAAKKEAEELKTRTGNDLKIASAQTIASLKQTIEKMIITKAIEPSVKSSLEDTSFIKEVIMAVAKAFNASDQAPKGLDIILPASMQKELDTFFGKQAVSVLEKGMDVSFSKHLSGGFKIGPKDGGYMISFAENDFENILAEYLRPSSKKLLFG